MEQKPYMLTDREAEWLRHMAQVHMERIGIGKKSSARRIIGGFQSEDTQQQLHDLSERLRG